MKKIHIFIILLIALFCVLPICAYFTQNKNTHSYSEDAESTDSITSEAISAALKIAINDYVWFYGEDSWEYCVFNNKELEYEYYVKEHEDIHRDFAEIALLFQQPLQIGFTDSKGYFVISLIKDKFSFDTEIYRISQSNNIEELRNSLKNYQKLGVGTIVFNDFKPPVYSKDSWQKFYMVQCISNEFLDQIGNTEITELYVLNFYESSNKTKILYAIGGEYYITYFSMTEHRCYKPLPVGDIETGIYYNDFYKNQFIKSAYKIDLR